MGSFKIWLENNLKREQEEQIQKLYDLTVKTLLGSASGQTQLSLSDIKDSATATKPPNQRGADVVLSKLTHAHIFRKMEQLGIPDIANRAHETQLWLQQIADKIGPNDTVGGLLNRLFGQDATETYGKHKWSAKPVSVPQLQEPQIQSQQPTPQQPPQPMMPGGQPTPQMPTPPPGGLQMA